MWMCERCQEINDDSRSVCSRCGAPKPAVAAPPMAGGAPPPMQPPTQPQARRAPQLVPTTTIHDQYHTPYRIDGELVPVLTVSVGAIPIYFEHYVLLWKHPSVTI